MLYGAIIIAVDVSGVPKNPTIFLSRCIDFPNYGLTWIIVCNTRRETDPDSWVRKRLVPPVVSIFFYYLHYTCLLVLCSHPLDLMQFQITVLIHPVLSLYYLHYVGSFCIRYTFKCIIVLVFVIFLVNIRIIGTMLYDLLVLIFVFVFHFILYVSIVNIVVDITIILGWDLVVIFRCLYEISTHFFCRIVFPVVLRYRLITKSGSPELAYNIPLSLQVLLPMMLLVSIMIDFDFLVAWT